MSDYATDDMIAKGKRLRFKKEQRPFRGGIDQAKMVIDDYRNHAADNLEAYENTIAVLWWALRWDQTIIAGPETTVEGLASLRTDVDG